jgi:hypothetical protein
METGEWIDIGMALTWIKASWSTQVEATTRSNCFSQVDEVGEKEVGRSM